MTKYLYLMRFDRPIGTLLLLWPTLMALWLAANGKPSLQVTLIFVSGVIIMRAAGCVINDIADRNYDGHVQRTKQRPIVSGLISVRQASMLFVGLMLLALFLALQLNRYALCLAFFAAGLAIVYPFAKRFTNYPQIILSLAFSWSIPMVYAQILGYMQYETWILFASIMSWIVAYDTQYALADKQDDLRIGIKSTAITFGKYVNFIIFLLQMCSLMGVAFIGYYRDFNPIFYMCLIIALMLCIYQQFLIKSSVPGQYIKAFKNNNYFGALIFLGICLGSL